MLKECLNHPEDSYGLPALEGSLTGRCSNVSSQEDADIQRQIETGFKPISQNLLRPYVMRDLYEQAMFNAAYSYVTYRLLYDSHPKVDDVLAKLCDNNNPHSSSRCDPKFSRILKGALSDNLPLMEKHAPTLSDEQSAAMFNEKIITFNRELSHIAIDPNNSVQSVAHVGLVYLGRPTLDSENTNRLRFYQKDFLNFSTQAQGWWLNTSALNRKVGALRNVSDDNEAEVNLFELGIEKVQPLLSDPVSYKFIPHPLVSASDIKAAHDEIEKRIEVEARKLNEIMNSKPQDLDLLVRLDPWALGQVMAENPAYLSVGCPALNEIHKHDQLKRGAVAGLSYGSALLLAFTGIGEGGAAALLTAIPRFALYSTVSQSGLDAYDVIQAYALKRRAKDQFWANSGVSDPQDSLDAEQSAKEKTNSFMSQLFWLPLPFLLPF